MVDWLHPTAYIPVKDYLEILTVGSERRQSEEGWRERRSRLAEMLGDYQPHRPTDLNSLMKLFSAAYAAHSQQPLTKRQGAAVWARSEAIQRGHTNATGIHEYVADTLGISRVSALQLLQRADAKLGSEALEAEIQQAPDLFVSSIDGHHTTAEREQAIWRCTASMRRECPGAGYEWCVSTRSALIPGRFELCPECYKHWGKLPLDQRPAWMAVRLREIRAELRQRAVEALEWVELEGGR